jgi:hypothetical protein
MSFEFEDHGAEAVVAAGQHFSFLVHPREICTGFNSADETEKVAPCTGAKTGWYRFHIRDEYLALLEQRTNRRAFARTVQVRIRVDYVAIEFLDHGYFHFDHVMTIKVPVKKFNKVFH